MSNIFQDYDAERLAAFAANAQAEANRLQRQYHKTKARADGRLAAQRQSEAAMARREIKRRKRQARAAGAGQP